MKTLVYSAPKEKLMYKVTFKDGTPAKLFNTVEEGFAEWIKGGKRDILEKVVQ